MTNLANVFRGAMGVKDYQWVKGFMSFMRMLGYEGLSDENLENHSYEVIVKGQPDNFPYLVLRNKSLNNDIFNQVQFETLMNKLGTLQPELGTPTSLLEDGATDPIFFEEGCMVRSFKLGRILISLVATGYSDDPEIVKLDGTKFNNWKEVTDYYRNDVELDKFFESGYADGIELPRFEVKVYLNRYHNPEIDTWMESHGYPKADNKHGIVDHMVMGVGNCIDWDEVFDNAITYDRFIDMFENGTAQLDTIREVYKDYI